jgi:hypothetical protein
MTHSHSNLRAKPRRELRDMNAGPQLDLLVAEKVMGWVKETDPNELKRLEIGLIPDDRRRWLKRPGGGWRYFAPAYSIDIAAAWQVIEKMLAMDIGIKVSRMPNNEMWHSTLYVKDEDGKYMATCEDRFEADTAPLAICMAALKAVGVE